MLAEFVGHRRVRRRAAVVAAVGVLAAVALAGPAAAGASSIVHIRDGNVWLSNPDGSAARQVTFAGGGSAGDYASPSQADDGTIVTGGGHLGRWDRSGRRLRKPLFLWPLDASAPYDPRVSPDGSKVAYWYIAPPCSGCGGGLRTGTVVTWADRNTDESVFGRQAPYKNPSWITNSRLLLFSGGAYVADLGTGADNARPWFAGNDAFYEGELTRAGDKIAIGGGETADGRTSARLHLYSTTGPFPAEPELRCVIEGATGAFQNLTWAPDGTALAWEEDDGIWTTPVPSLADCDVLAAGARLAIPGGKDPDWGPAEVGQAEDQQPPEQRDVVPPVARPTPLVLSALAAVPRSFRARRGTTVTYRLSAPATTTFTLARAVRGSRRGNRCVPPRRGGRRCTRYVPVRGSVMHAGSAGINRVRLIRIAERALRPGRYRLTAVARDAASQTSQPVSLTIKVRR
jgi:hypothetical protein